MECGLTLHTGGRYVLCGILFSSTQREGVYFVESGLSLQKKGRYLLFGNIIFTQRKLITLWNLFILQQRKNIDLVKQIFLFQSFFCLGYIGGTANLAL